MTAYPVWLAHDALLAERTNGRAYATMLRPSVTYVLWLNGVS